MDYDYSKWNNYVIGKIPWLNGRRNHISRDKFVDYITKSNFKNILEIGAGEVIEGSKIKDLNKNIDYKLLDVSDVFLENARKLGFDAIKGEMHKTPFEDKQFDLIYLAAVLEHSPNIRETFEEFKRISKNFYFTMFKWNMKSGGLKSSFHRRKYFTSFLNINKLLELLSTYGTIKELFICTENGKIIEYNKYKKQLKNIDSHRNGNWLSIVGEFND